MENGTLITIEGIDGAGKSTVLESLNEEFPNAVFTSEPQEDQWLGTVLRKALSDEDMSDMSLFFLFLSEHAQHIEDYVNPALEENKLVISDRFVDSRYAYQTYALDNLVNGETLQWIQNIQENGWSTIPDQTIILDISVDTSLERIADNKKEVFEKRDRLEAARDIYLNLAEEDNERYTVVDAEQSPEYVIDKCKEIINNEIQ
jgi:dTMP kinase